MVNEIEVKSSAISRVKYNTETKDLTITFTSGGSYDYPAVPPEIVSGLIHAESVGKYFHKHVKQFAKKIY